MSEENDQATLRIGWAQTNITPDDPVLIAGQFHARISEGVEDRVTATAFAFATESDHAVFVSCDLVTISEELRDLVRELLKEGTEGLDPAKVILNATHTHTAPEIRVPRIGSGACRGSSQTTTAWARSTEELKRPP